jgi:DNA invertase Pin-like site-specific DNA recombinase
MAITFAAKDQVLDPKTRSEVVVLDGGANVYIRQSTGAQLQENLESLRRQYDLVDLARRYGFRDVAVIDADLGRSASGTVDRQGLRDLVGRICEGGVGAVFCLEASRLARNGRDWHHMFELCGLVGAFVIKLGRLADMIEIARKLSASFDFSIPQDLAWSIVREDTPLARLVRESGRIGAWREIARTLRISVP